MLIYLRDLSDLFAAAATALRPGGLFVFSTELATDAECGGVPPHGKGWVERDSERVAHSEEYLRCCVVGAGGGLLLRSLQAAYRRHIPYVSVRRELGTC